jgi:hypothetical protein
MQGSEIGFRLMASVCFERGGFMRCWRACSVFCCRSHRRCHLVSDAVQSIGFHNGSRFAAGGSGCDSRREEKVL